MNMNMLKNQFGLVALAAVILIVAGLAFFGSDSQPDDIVLELGEEGAAATENEDTQAPAAAAPKPKTTAPKPATSAPAPTPAPSTSGLNGSTFRLTSYNGIVIPGGDIYTVSFKAGSGTFEDGFVSAKFCNSMSGPYNITNGMMSANMSSNRAYCGEPTNLMDLEGAFSVLMGSSRITLSGNTLTLTDNVKTMVFVRQ